MKYVLVVLDQLSPNGNLLGIFTILLVALPHEVQSRGRIGNVIRKIIHDLAVGTDRMVALVK